MEFKWDKILSITYACIPALLTAYFYFLPNVLVKKQYYSHLRKIINTENWDLSETAKNKIIKKFTAYGTYMAYIGFYVSMIFGFIISFLQKDIKPDAYISVPITFLIAGGYLLFKSTQQTDYMLKHEKWFTIIMALGTIYFVVNVFHKYSLL